MQLNFASRDSEHSKNPLRTLGRIAAAVIAVWVYSTSAWANDVPGRVVATGEVSERRGPQVVADEAVEMARRLIDAGQPEAAYEILRQSMQALSLENIDTATIRFLAAQALLAGGHHAQAEQLLRRLVDDRPDLLPVQLEYATILFELGRDDEADAIFREIRRKRELPPLVQRDVEDFLERIRLRQRWRIDFDLGFWRDDNVNNAPESEAVAIPAFGGLRFSLDQQPIPAWVARIGVHLRWREPMVKSGRNFFETHVSVSRNTAIRASEYNRTWLSVSTGPRIHYSAEVAGRPRPGMFHADTGVVLRWRGSREYATSPWASIGVEQAVGRNWRLGGSARLWVTRYDTGSGDAQPWGRSLALYATRLVWPGWLTMGGEISRETPERRSLRWASHKVWLRYAADIGQDWSVSFRAGLTRTRFDAEEPLFLKRREEQTHDVSLTVSHRALAWEGYLPELALNWNRTRSNIPIYNREVRTLRLSLRQLF